MGLILIVIFISTIFLVGLYKVKIKGIIGEKNVSSRLFFLDRSKYKVINNIVLRSGEITSQIDHLVISDFGIFVIETKNFSGWIVGDENSEYWSQVIYKYKTRFYNPLRQNLGHIKALKKCLIEYPKIEYKSIVVFSTKAEIKVITNNEVINSHHLLQTIKKYSQRNLTEIDKENIFKKINTSNLIGSYSKSEHIRSINHRIENRKKKIIQNLCPQCGNDLVERNGKFGRFVGCKSYPNCKFTIKI